MGRSRRSTISSTRSRAPSVSSRSQPVTADRMYGKSTALLVAIVWIVLFSNVSGTGKEDGKGSGASQKNEHFVAQEGEEFVPASSDLELQAGQLQAGMVAEAGQKLHEQNRKKQVEEFGELEGKVAESTVEVDGTRNGDFVKAEDGILQVEGNMVEVGEEARKNESDETTARTGDSLLQANRSDRTGDQTSEVDRTRHSGQTFELDTVKAPRVSPSSLDEYRKRLSFDPQRGPLCGEGDGGVQVQHRLEPSGEKYNFAAASHGAKLVAANKEAKGAGSILHNDKEKYYRSPCSAEDKFVVIELSEETLADMFVVANFEFYSSNLKEFELLGSLSYPTEDWISLGRFEAENTRQAHSFRLPKPEWIRYLKLRMLNHYGSEFYCTLSTIEVYGIDAIECLLEEWLGRTTTVHPQEPSNSTAVGDGDCRRMDDTKDPRSNVVVSRLGDSVLKVLMQKVKALEFNQSLFEQYVEELGSNYGALLGEFEGDLAVLKGSLLDITSSISSLVAVLSSMKQEQDAKWLLLQSELSKQSDIEVAYLESLRAQTHHMENRETVAVTLAFLLILVSSLSHILARCLPPRKCNELSVLRFVLFWSGCLIAAILSFEFGGKQSAKKQEKEPKFLKDGDAGFVKMVLSKQPW